MTAAVALCVLPADRSRRVMDWATAERLPWGILILFGGGLSLAAAVQANGVAEFLSAHAMALGGLPPIALVLAVTTGVILLTELTSNTATTATLVPILAAFAPGLGVHPDYLILPATIAASCAFMLPVATPPNALVFGSGYVTIPEMARAGIWMNLIGIVLITVVMYAVIIPLFRLA
jgi:sodium-dependent dicarboxylate transporter 2/3/5